MKAPNKARRDIKAKVCVTRPNLGSRTERLQKTYRVLLQEFIQKLTQSLQQYIKHHAGHLEQAIFRKKIEALNGKSL